MQNEYEDDFGFGQSAHQEGPNAQPMNPGFIVTKEDSAILEEYIVKFKAADTAGRTILIEEAMGRLYGQRPENAPFDKMDARTAGYTYILMLQHLTVHFRRYRSGCITATRALASNTSSSLASGLPETPSITSTVVRCCSILKKCIRHNRVIRHS
jgi:hypothetical protein